MSAVVNKVIRKVKWLRLKDKLVRKVQRDVIVISHAPLKDIHDQQDPCHIGFKCFYQFINKISPLLWIHGHVHISDMHTNQVTVLGKTTVLNTFCYKFININKGKIDISYKQDLLDT